MINMSIIDIIRFILGILIILDLIALGFLIVIFIAFLSTIKKIYPPFIG